MKNAMVVIGGKEADDFNYGPVVGKRGKVLGREAGPIPYYEVQIEGTTDPHQNIWYIQEDDCLPIAIGNRESIKSLKEDVVL